MEKDRIIFSGRSRQTSKLFSSYEELLKTTQMETFYHEYWDAMSQSPTSPTGIHKSALSCLKEPSEPFARVYMIPMAYGRAFPIYVCY